MTWYGPVPTGDRSNSASPTTRAYAAGMMPAIGIVSQYGSAPLGSSSRISSVRSSRTTIPSSWLAVPSTNACVPEMPSAAKAPCASEPLDGSVWRSMEYRTSSAVSGVPSWKVTPSRSRMRYAVPSAVSGSDAASPGRSACPSVSQRRSKTA